VIDAMAARYDVTVEELIEARRDRERAFKLPRLA
jgi:hypothetical protein